MTQCPLCHNTGYLRVNGGVRLCHCRWERKGRADWRYCALGVGLYVLTVVLSCWVVP